MTDNQNPERQQFDPGNITGRRLRAVDSGIEKLAAARQSMNKHSDAVRRPTHPLVGVSDTPKDMWQQHADRFQVVSPSQEVAAHEERIAREQAGREEKAPSAAQGEYESPDELLRKALEDVKTALDAAPREDARL